MSFISLIFLISFIVFVYIKFYIAGDEIIDRFIKSVFFFVISIILLVLSPNLVRIILGWGGLELVKFILIIYYQNFNSLKSLIIIVLINWVGDSIYVLKFFYFVSYLF